MFVVLLPARRYFSYLACVTVSLWQAQTSRRHYHNATAEWRSDNYTVQMTYYCYLTTLTEPSRCCLELNDCTRKIRKGLSRSGRGYHQGVVIQSQRTKEIRGTAVAQWLRCCATNRKAAGSIPDGVIGIFHWYNPSDRTMALGSTQRLT